MFCLNDYENNLIDLLNNIKSFEIYKNGEKEKISHADERFYLTISKLKELFVNSRLMPAFGVSLHSETLNELKSGNWLQINFKQEITKNGLPFTALLFKLDQVHGFNLIRIFNNRYEGRCLYLDLDEQTNLNDLINF